MSHYAYQAKQKIHEAKPVTFHFQCASCSHRWTAVNQTDEPMCPVCLGPAIVLKVEK